MLKMQKGNLCSGSLRGMSCYLLSQLKVGQDSSVPFNVSVHEVVQQFFALTYQPQEALLSRKILFIRLQVFCEVIYAVREKCNLRFSRTSIRFLLA